MSSPPRFLLRNLPKGAQSQKTKTRMETVFTKAHQFTRDFPAEALVVVKLDDDFHIFMSTKTSRWLPSLPEVELNAVTLRTPEDYTSIADHKRREDSTIRDDDTFVEVVEPTEVADAVETPRNHSPHPACKADPIGVDDAAPVAANIGLPGDSPPHPVGLSLLSGLMAYPSSVPGVFPDVQDIGPQPDLLAQQTSDFGYDFPDFSDWALDPLPDESLFQIPPQVKALDSSNKRSRSESTSPTPPDRPPVQKQRSNKHKVPKIPQLPKYRGRSLVRSRRET